MADSEVVRIIKEQRDAVNRNEKDTLKRLARLWVPSYRYLQDQVRDLLQLIRQKQAKGEPVEIEYIYSLERYQRMMDEAKMMIRRYNRAAAKQIRGDMTEMSDLGYMDATRVVSVAEPDSPMWTRVNKSPARVTAAMTQDDAPLDRLLDKSFGQMKTGMEQALITGIATGQGSRWIAEQMMNAANIPEQRALLIARTEVNRAYRQANWERQRDSRAVVGYRRMCYKPTACFACLMLDGEFYPKTREPTDHPNGKCSFVPVTKHFDPANMEGWEKGSEWLQKQSEEDQRRIMGNSRYELMRDGYDPRDMVWIKPNDTWGGSPAVKPLKELGFGYRGKYISYPTEHGTINKSREITPTSVNWDVVLTPEWHNKFKGITDDEATNETLYQKALDILNHRQNTIYEDMHLIDSKTGKVVGSQTHSTATDHSVPYNKSLTSAMEKYPGRLISIHNHATNLPPTGSDFYSNFERNYLSGVVICHNGDVYVYNSSDKRATRRLIDYSLQDAKTGETFVPEKVEEIMQKMMQELKISWRKL